MGRKRPAAERKRLELMFSRVALLLLAFPLTCAADAWTPFYGSDKAARSIALDVPDDGSSIVVSSSFDELPSGLYGTRNENVIRLQTNIVVTAAVGEASVYRKQRCEWTIHYRAHRKRIVKSSLYCSSEGQSPIAGSYYEARGNKGVYHCVQHCARNPFRTLRKDTESEH